MMYKCKCIVLIEDDDDTLTLLRYWIAREKVAPHVHAFHNGHDASEFIKTVSGHGNKHWPSLIVLDTYLPDSTGFDFLKEMMPLWGINPKPKIFFISGSKNITDVKKASAFDIDAFINKPLNKKKLTKLLSRVAS